MTEELDRTWRSIHSRHNLLIIHWQPQKIKPCAYECKQWKMIFACRGGMYKLCVLTHRSLGCFFCFPQRFIFTWSNLFVICVFWRQNFSHLPGGAPFYFISYLPPIQLCPFKRKKKVLLLLIRSDLSTAEGLAQISVIYSSFTLSRPKGKYKELLSSETTSFYYINPT